MAAAPTTTASSPATSAHPLKAHPAVTAQDIMEQASKFVSGLDMQRTWGLSHLAFLTFVAIYLVNATLFNSRFLNLSYKMSMLCLLTGYGIAIRRHLGPMSADLHTLERAFSYDGTPYFCLALMWWVMSVPVPITLIPLAIYSTYHAIAWAKDDVVVKKSAEWRQWGEACCMRMTAQQSSLLFAAAHLEVAALPYMILAWLIAKRGPGFPQLLFYMQFLRWQHSVSPKIRAAFKQWEAAWDGAIQHPSCPKNIRSGDRWLREQLRVVSQMTSPATHSHQNGQMNRSTSGSVRSGFPGAGSKKMN